jgi:DNA polymerase-1
MSDSILIGNNKKYIIDFSYYIWAGTYAFTTKCSCNNEESCTRCGGKGKLPLQNSRGTHTGGLYLVFQQIIDKLKDGWDVLLAFDPPREDLARTKMLDSYKAQRGEKPEAISEQMNIGKEILSLVKNIECYSSNDAESDDTMATLAVLYAQLGCEVIVASRDKDMFPLLDIDGITIYRDGGILTKNDFIEKYGFPPSRFNEYLALCGDAVDNFNLFKGLGDKAAKELIKNTKHISEIFDKGIWENIPKKYQKILAVYDDSGNFVRQRKDDLTLSLQLATLDYNAKYFKVNNNHDESIFKNKIERLELKSVLRNMEVLFGEI